MRLIRRALILALGFNAAQEVHAQCARSIKAQQGDTCASIAALVGITVSQFLKSNPSVTSCSTLSPGATYCIDGVATGAPAASSSTAPTSPSTGLEVSNDGTCGAGVTCKGSRFGNCCSAHGFCGSSADYCGDGCQPGLGSCGSDPGPITSPPGGTATSTVTVTSTATTTSTAIVTITRATIVVTTSTATVQVTNTVAATRTVVQSAVATTTVTARVTTTATAVATATSTVRATVLTTSIVTLTSIVISTRTATATVSRTNQAVVTSTATATTRITSTTRVTATSVVIETLTTIKTVSITTVNTVCGGGPSLVTTIYQPTTGRPTPTSIITIGPGPGGPGGVKPNPYLPGSSKNCRYFDQIQSGDSCRDIANRNSVTLYDFYQLNPSVSSTGRDSVLGSLLCTPDLIELLLNGLCQIDCDDLWPGYFVCVGE